MAFNQATAQPEGPVFDAGTATAEDTGGRPTSFKFDIGSAAPEAAPAKAGGWGELKVAALKAHLIRNGAPPDVAERTARDPDTQARQDALAQPGGVRKQFLGSLTGSMLPEGFTTTVSPFVQRMMLASQLDPESGRVPDASLRELITPNPNSTSAGVAQAGTEFVRQNVNPLNAMLLGGGTALGALAKGTGPVANAARLALRAMGVGFGAQQAQTAGEQAGAASVPQPGQTPAQRAAAWTAPALSAAASLASTASAFAPGRPGGAAPVTDAELRGARNVSPVPEQQRLAGNQPLALPAPKAEAPAPAPQAAPTTIPGKLAAEETIPVEPTVFREGQEVSYSLPDGQEARGIVAASTANGRVKITTQTGETLRVPIARVSNVAPEATKAPEGFDAASAEPDIEVSLSEPEVSPSPPARIPADIPEGSPQHVADKIAYLNEQLATREITPDEHARLVSEAKISAKPIAPVNFQPVVAETPDGKTVPVKSQLAGGGPTAPDNFTAALKTAWDRYDETGESTVEDLANEVESLLAESPDDARAGKLSEALDRYRDELRDNHEMAGRNDMDAAEEAFTKAIGKAMARKAPKSPDFSLETVTPEQQAAEAAAKKAQLEAKARQDKIEKLSERPLTGDSSNVAQGQIFSGDEDLFSGPSLESEASPAPAGPRTAMSAADRARMRAEEMPELQAQMGIGGYTLRDLFVGKRAALSNAGLSSPLRLQSPSVAAAKGGWSGELKSMRESAPFSWFHNRGVNVEDGLMETLNELGFDAKSPEEALDMVRRAAAGEDVHPTGSSAQFRSERGGVDARVLRTLAVTGAAGGGAAYGYSQGTSEEDKIRKAIGYGAAAAVAAYIASKIPEAFADNAAGGMAVALRAARNSIENAVIGGKDLPNMRAASEPATNAAFRLANARIYGVQQGLNLAAQVLGDHWNDPVFAEKLGSVLVQEMQEAKIIQLHDALLAAKTPGEKAKIQGQIDRVKPVWDMPATQINSPQEFRDALADPEIQAAIERHKKLVQATAEQIHVELGGKLAAVGPNTGAFINTEAILAGNDLPGAANKGDLQNVLKRRTAFGKGRTGTADQYEIDYNRQVARMAAGNAERIAKKDYYDTLEQEGLAEVTQPGERPADAEKFRRERTQELSVTGRLEDTWIRRDIFGEHRQLMNTDSPLDNHMVMVAARIANLVQLKSITDPTFHVANIVSSIAGAQGGGSRLADIGRQMPGVNVADALVRVGNRLGDVSKMDPQTRADLAEIARVGGLREGHPGLVNSVDRAGRLVMNDLFQSLVDEGLAKDSEGNRRDFVNQIGQYNARLMGKIKAFFKEVGIAPFIVAGQNFNRLGVRRLLQQPGVTATGAGAAAKMVGTAFAGTLASLVAAPAIFNYLANRNDDRVKNKLLGPSGTPVGAIGWQDPDANGKPGTLHYVDPLKWTNLRRGARITGLNAVASGIVQGRDLNHTVGQAWEDIRNGAVQPWAGPAINAFSILATGKNAAGFQEAEVANPLDRTQSPTASQAGRNATAAASHLQPQVAAFLQGGRDKNPAKFDAGAGAKGVVKSLARAGGYFERNPVDAEHGAAESALYSEELGREQRREQIQKLASGWPTMTQAEKTKATDGMSELDGKDLVEALHQNSLGFTSADRMIHSMGVEDGARAKYLADQVMKLSPSEQLKYLDDKDRKGLITDNVSGQLVEELKARGFKPAKAK